MKYLTVIFCFFIIISCKRKEKEVEIKNNIQENVIIKKEKAAYNLLDYTEDFSDQTWQLTKAVVTENVTSSPLIRKSADLLDLSKNPKDARIAQVIPNLKAGHYAFSVYVKALPNEGGNHAIAIYSKGENGSFKSTTVAVNNYEWTRVIVKVSQDSYGDIIVYPVNKQIITSELDKLYIWGAQLEKIEILNQTIKAYAGKSVIE